jgi:hypothetical protein
MMLRIKLRVRVRLVKNKLTKMLLTELESNKIQSTKEVPAEWTCLWNSLLNNKENSIEKLQQKSYIENNIPLR